MFVGTFDTPLGARYGFEPAWGDRVVAVFAFLFRHYNSPFRALCLVRTFKKLAYQSSKSAQTI